MNDTKMSHKVHPASPLVFERRLSEIYASAGSQPATPLLLLCAGQAANSESTCVLESQMRRLVNEREGVRLERRRLSFVFTSGARSSDFVQEVPHRLLCLAHHGRRGWEEARDKARPAQRPPACGGSHNRLLPP